MELAVATLTISPKFQVVIPKAIRERLGLSPGQKVQAVLYGNRIELIPPRAGEAPPRISQGHRYQGSS